MTHLVNVPNARERVRADQEMLAVAAGATGSQYRRAAHTHRNICARHSFFFARNDFARPALRGKERALVFAVLACLRASTQRHASRFSKRWGAETDSALLACRHTVNVIQSPLQNDHERNRSQAANIATSWRFCDKG